MTQKRLRDVDTGDQAEQLRFTGMVLVPGVIMLHYLEQLVWGSGYFLLRAALNIALLVLLSRLIWPLIHHGSTTFINGLLAGGGEERTVEYSEVEALVVQGRFDEALVMYRAIADETPDADVRLRLGDLMLHQLKDPIGAEEAYLAARRGALRPRRSRNRGSPTR